MEKKTSKHPCAECVWQLWTGTSEIVMCTFPVYQRLKHEPPERKGPNYCHFPLNEEAGYDEVYFRGLTSEKAVVRFRKGRSVTVWELKDSSYKRNEPLDLRNYATAALEIANPVLQKVEPDMERRQKKPGRRRLSGGI